MRCFIAIKFPEEILDKIQGIQEESAKGKLFEGKFTERENLHLTLKFFGELDERKIERIREKLKEIKKERFDAEIKEMGVFNEDIVRIIWLKVNGEGVLDLQKDIDEKLAEFFKKEERFMSHVTIARVKKCEDKRKLISELKEIRIPQMNFLVREFYLISSVLKKEKAEYSVIEKFELG